MYYVWITAIIGLYDSKIAGTLVKRGFTVASLADKRVTTEKKDTVGAVIAFSVVPPEDLVPKDKKVNASAVYEEVLDVLKFHKVKYFSVIVSDGGIGCTWNIGNIKEDVAEPETKENKTVN